MSYAIGIDVGGTFIKYGLSDDRGSILYESIKPTYLPDKRVYDNLLDIIAGLREYAGSKGFALEGIGIGVPGIVDQGLVTGCFANLPELEGMALGHRLKEQLGMPVFVENDANLMGLAEWKFGAARGASDVVFLTIGTGIGGAMVLNGQLYAGHRNRGAELGHIIIQADGHPRPCGCGGKGCLEAHASVNALIEDYKTCLTDPERAHPELKKIYAEQESLHPKQESVHPETEEAITGHLVISRYLEKQPAAVTAMNRHFDFLAAGIAGIINIFSPQKLIIGGGISEAGDFYIHEIRERAMDRAMKETSLDTSIEPAELGNKAGFLGAVALVFNSVAKA